MGELSLPYLKTLHNDPMKKFILIFTFAIGVCLLFAAFSRIKVPETFPVVLDLKTEKVPIPPVLYHVNKMICSDYHLLAMSIKTDTIYRVFELPGLIYNGGFGRKGNGPMEFINPSISNFFPDKDVFILGDLKYFRTVKISNAVNHGFSIKELKRTPVPGALRNFNQLAQINDSIVVGYTIFKDEKDLLFFNTRTNKSWYDFDFPDVGINIPDNYLGITFLKYIGLKPDKKRIAFAYQRFPMLRIYSMDGKLIKDVRIKEASKQKKFVYSSARAFADTYTYYENIVTTEKYIYAMYHETMSDASSNQTIRQIHVFDWDGNPLVKYILDDWMKTYTVNPDDSYIYFFNPDVENAIYRAKTNLPKPK
jgi:hypothetical protein